MTDKPYRRIATEEAYAPAEMLDEYRKILDAGTGEIGFKSLLGHFLRNPHGQPAAVRHKLAQLGEERLADMDATGIDVQILSLTSPGTQVFDVDTAKWIAELANDRMAEATKAHPDRYAFLAAVGFEDAPTAIAELERAVKLGAKGVIANSHVKGKYLDHPDFFPIWEAAAALDVPIYLHPQTLPDYAIKAYVEAGVDGAMWGFAAETGLELLRMITSGLFDKLPNLRLVVGHLGEGLPYFMHRIDHMHAKAVASNRYESIKALSQAPSEYLKTHIWLTTSGMPATEPILFARKQVGADRVMYAMDYPYQFVKEEVDEQDALPISDEEKKDFFEGIATRVFKL